jgi:hypothetical protein
MAVLMAAGYPQWPSALPVDRFHVGFSWTMMEVRRWRRWSEGRAIVTKVAELLMVMFKGRGFLGAVLLPSG